MTAAWQLQELGNPEALVRTEIDTPEPGAGEVLVELASTSVNPVDWKTRDGNFPPVGEDDLPLVLGRDVAGTVVATGPGLSRLASGKAVYGMPDFKRGSFAGQVVMKESELAELPAAVDPAIAGGIPLCGLTAWQGLFEHGELKKDERVLVHGGAGGVGHLAVQFALMTGAEVFATGRAQDAAMMDKLGVARFVDTDAEAFDEALENVDLVLDLLGGEIQNRSFAVLRQGGRMISSLDAPDEDKAAERNIRVGRYMAHPDAEALVRIARAFEAGAVSLHVMKRFAFDKLDEALVTLQEEHVQGKILIEAP